MVAGHVLSVSLSLLLLHAYPSQIRLRCVVGASLSCCKEIGPCCSHLASNTDDPIQTVHRVIALFRPD